MPALEKTHELGPVEVFRSFSTSLSVADRDVLIIAVDRDVQHIAVCLRRSSDRAAEMLLIQGQSEVGLDAQRLLNVLSGDTIGLIRIVTFGIVRIDDVDAFQIRLRPCSTYT